MMKCECGSNLFTSRCDTHGSWIRTFEVTRDGATQLLSSSYGEMRIGNCDGVAFCIGCGAAQEFDALGAKVVEHHEAQAAEPCKA